MWVVTILFRMVDKVDWLMKSFTFFQCHWESEPEDPLLTETWRDGYPERHSRS